MEGPDRRRAPHRILTWSADKTAIVWDTASCWPLLTKRHREVVRGGKVLPSGDRCVTCSAFGRCGIWDATTGEISTISGHGGGWVSEWVGDRMVPSLDSELREPSWEGQL